MSFKRLFYTFFLYLILPLVLLRLFFRSRANVSYRQRLSERFGLVNNISTKPVIWLHAVSVGEVIAAKPLLDALLVENNKTSILVTTTTPTGSDRVQEMYADEIQKHRLLHSYFPYDLLGAVSRFIKAFEPQILIVVETEIWPNLYSICQQKNIPVMMVNARLSQKSTQAYLKIKGLIAETLSTVKVIAVRSKEDAARFEQLGAKTEQIVATANIKYDISVDQEQIKKAQKLLGIWGFTDDEKHPIFVAASTHKGEDEKILGIYLNLLKQFPKLLLVIVPRHPERFNEVYNQYIQQLPAEIKVIKRSQFGDNLTVNKQNANVILGDSMGEMQVWYAVADVVFIGGSLVETGGHNPLEATLFGVPVVSGPHMFNFDDIATELSNANLLTVCDNEYEIDKTLSQILTDKNDAKDKLFTEKAAKFMKQHQGVTSRLLKIISKQIKNSDESITDNDNNDNNKN